jgi:8-oxo-dGTP diphosphatase
MITCIFEDQGKGSLRHVTVDVILEQDNKLLLVKRAQHLSEGGKWALPGGFLDRNETVEQGARREIVEESGYKVENLTFFMLISHPDRPREDRQNVNLSFIADVGEQVQKPDAETEGVQWFGIASLPPTEDIAFDHSMIIKKYLEYRRNHFQLPILI